MSTYQNSINKNNDEEIDLIELVKMIFNHFIMVLSIVVIFSAIGVAIALLMPEKHDINAIIEIKAPYDSSVLKRYGIDSYSYDDVMKKMFTETSMMKALPETDKVITSKALVDTIKYDNIPGTHYYKISVDKAEDIAFYVELINNLVKDAGEEIVTKYTKPAEEGLKLAINELADFRKEFSDYTTSDFFSGVNMYLAHENAINYFISIIPEAVTYVEEPIVSEENTGFGKAKLCIIFFFIGGIVGVLSAWCIDFSDKRIYNSDKLRELTGDKLVASIPLYKDGNAISPLEYSYIATKLNNPSSILITSLSSKAGKSTIAKGLNKELSGVIIDSPSISKTPEALVESKNNDIVLVVIRAGVDTFPKLDKLITDLKTQGDNYMFILNAVEYSDKNVNLYSSKDNYIKHKWLKESWKHYYDKNYPAIENQV